jgi:tRNA dimethylallyltransferase
MSEDIAYSSSLTPHSSVMPKNGRPEIVLLTGPTAVGKTAVGVAVARALGTEIVSADSMQVYRRMEAGTAKPSAAERAAVPHHLVDIVDPVEPFTVAEYRERAIPVIEEMLSRGRLPLVVGGTRLYLLSLIEPFFSGPPPVPEFRAALAERAAADLHAELSHVDPAAAARLHPADRKRIVRALEAFAHGGVPISELQRRSRETGGRFRAQLIALVREREELYRRVDARVESMIGAGLIEEVERFRQEGLTEQDIAMQAHGYKEVLGYLTGRYDREEAIRLLKRNTRHYVKYQLGWLRQRDDVQYVRADAPESEVVAAVIALIRTGQAAT